MPKERSAPNFVTATTAVELRIKEIILSDLLKGIDRHTTFRKLKTLIEAFGKRIRDENVRLKFETSLAQNALRLYGKTQMELEEMAGSYGIPLHALILAISGKPRRANNEPTEDKTPATPPHTPSADKIREFLYEDRIEIPDYHAKVKAEIRKIAENLADEEMKDRNGASLRNVAEIHVRHDYQQASIEQMRNDGVRLVWASTHFDCSKRCFPWQGRLYSLDGSSGVTDTGVPYIPLETAVNVPYTTKAGKTYMNGLLGFNCRHRLIPYKDEQVPPQGYTAAQTRRAYCIDQTQRAIEREIRKVKTRAHLIRDIGVASRGEVSSLFRTARQMTAAYRKYCERHNTVAMIYRTQVTLEEQAINRNNYFNARGT